MAPGDGGATGKRKRGKRTDEGDSGRDSPGGGGGGHATEVSPNADARKKPKGTEAMTDTAAPPYLPPPPPVHMDPGHGGATGKRKRGKRTDAPGDSGRDSPGGGGGGQATEGSPDAPAAPTAQAENVAVPGRISVAHTPNIPLRFEGLVKSITSLIPYESKGKSYECMLSQMYTFLRWSKSEMALFFEWSDDENEATCWMHNILKRTHVKLTVNAAFSHEMEKINVERAAVAFSTNFIGGDEDWSDLKDMLLNLFGSFKGEGKEYDYLFVFTRVGASVYFRNFKIISLPKADDPSSVLELTEINTMFCLKLANDQGTLNSSNIGPHLPKAQIPTKLILCPVTLYSISNGQTGFSLSHVVDFSGETYSVLFDNGSYVSSLQELEGFNISLAEIVVKEPLLKIKHIIGSLTKKTCCFLRERCKSILQSLFAEFAMLLESGKCISEMGQIYMHNVLVRGASVRIYGVDLTDYTEDLAKRSVQQLVVMTRNCFPSGTIPLDLAELLEELHKNPLDQIRIAKDDCSLMKAEDRRTLLINLNSEYMTNVEEESSDEEIDKKTNKEINKKINDITFFKECPYALDWKQTMQDNEYMVQVCNVDENESDEDSDAGNQNVDAPSMQRMKEKGQMSRNTVSIKESTKKKKQESHAGNQNVDVQRMKRKQQMSRNTVSIKESTKKKKQESDAGNQDVDASVMQRMKKKMQMSRNTASIKKYTKKKKQESNIGRLQFSSKINFAMHMPEKARKDGIIPFRLGMADYILTSYFPRFLRFVQKRMREVKAQRGEFKKRKSPSYVVRRSQPQ